MSQPLKRIGIAITITVLVFLVLLYWSVSSTPKDFSTCNLLEIENINNVNFKNHDSVLVSASFLYKPNEIKKLMQGEQYRQAWAAPIKAPVVFLDTLFGGVNILKEGGGKQTHSLKLKGKNGIIYTLRSINKDPEALVPEFLKALGLENVVIDGISAQHPYGAILAAEIQRLSGVIHTHPKVLFLPKQKTLSNYNDKYGNRLYLLEYETEGAVNWTQLNDVTELLDTEDLQELKIEKADAVRINKDMMIRTRLVDFIIGDWDRHAKQWGWAIQKNESGYEAVPIAGDRDNAFFNVEGIVPSILSSKNVVPELRPFKEDIQFLEGMVYPFDRYFLFNTDISIFTDQAKYLQKTLTDDKLEAALNVWPENIVKLDGHTIIRKIKARRDKLMDYAIKFKDIIDAKGVLEEPLKGSEDLNLEKGLLQCFECK